MKKIIKPKPVGSGNAFGKKVDCFHLTGKVIGIYQKGTKQISKVLFQPSVVDLDFDGWEANLGKDVFLETILELEHVKLKKTQSGKSKQKSSGAKLSHRKTG